MGNWEMGPGSEFFRWAYYQSEPVLAKAKRRQPQQSAQMPVFSLDGELEQMLQSGFVCHAATVNGNRDH